MLRARAGACVALLLLASACGDDDGSNANVHAPTTFEPALGSLCDLIERCPNFHPLATRSRNECIDVLYWLLTCRLDEQNDELVGVRRIDLNLTAAQSQACAAVFDGLSCEALNGSLNTAVGSEGAACLPLFAGLSDDDEARDPVATGCQYSGQCPAGTYCPTATYDDAAMAPACRACRGPLQRGDTCERYNVSVPCDEGLICVDEEGSGDGSGVCGDPLPNGGYCDNDDECESGFCEYGVHECSAGRADGEGCSAASWCLSGYCHAFNSVDNRCASTGRAGDACNVIGDCLEPLACIDGECTPKREVGEACTADEHCTINVCDTQDQRCGIRDGAPCDVEPYVGLCRSGWCDNESYICRAKVATGEDCSFSQVCEIGWCDSFDLRCGIAVGHNCRYMTQYCRDGFCDNDTGLCTVLQSHGAACTAHTQCASGFCDVSSQTCAPDLRPLPDGAACNDNADCASQACSSTCYTRCSDNDECETGEYCNWQSQRCQPLLDAGSSCESDEDCSSGFCNDDDLCAIKPAIGEPCAGFSDCYPLGYCSNDVCVARVRPGAACDRQDACLEPYVCLDGSCKLPSLRCEPAPLGEPCTYFRFCSDGGYCDPSTLSCVPQHGAGGSCARDEECAGSLYCNYNAAGGPTCERASVVAEACDESQPCVRDATCVNGTCAETVYCETSADCSDGTYCEQGVCAPHGQQGDRCINSAQDMCAPGLFCDIDCEPRVAMGQSCASYMPCLEGLRCDRDTSTCQPSLGAGEACDSDQDCGSGLFCESYDTCQPLRDFGERCDSDWHCESGICFQDYCSASRACAMSGG